MADPEAVAALAEGVAEFDQPTWRGIPLTFPNGTPELYDPDDLHWLCQYVVTVTVTDGRLITIVSPVVNAAGEVCGDGWDEELGGADEKNSVRVALADIVEIEVP